MSDDDLLSRIRQKSDDELRHMLVFDSANYRQEALDIAVREATKRGVSLNPPEPKELPSPPPPPPLGALYAADGKQIICPHCRNTRFIERRVLMKTPLMFFELSWLDTTALTLTCLQCARIEWFTHAQRYG